MYRGKACVAALMYRGVACVAPLHGAGLLRPQIAPVPAHSALKHVEAAKKNAKFYCDLISDQSRVGLFYLHLPNLVYWVGFGTVMALKCAFVNSNFHCFLPC